MKEFLQDHNGLLYEQLTDAFWIKIAYLADTFALYSETNKWMQGPGSNIMQCKDALDAFLRKLEYKVGKMSKGELQHFPLSLKQSGGVVCASLRTEFTQHMNLLWEEIKSRVSDTECLSKESWMMDLYISTLKDVEYLGCEEELCDLQANTVSRKYFQENGHKRF